MFYDYLCLNCNILYEIQHGMSCEDNYECPECNACLEKQISSNFHIGGSMKATWADLKEENHHKKVKDFDRAVKSRKRGFGHDAVGNPEDKPDPKHLVRGKVIAGQDKEIDKQEFIKSAAKDPLMVKVAQDAIKKSKK